MPTPSAPISTTKPSNLRSETSASTNKPIPTSQSLLHRLLGPLHPLLSAHTIPDAGASVWFPTHAILLYRLCCTDFLLLTLILFSLTRALSPSTLGFWVYLLCTFSMLCSTLASLRHLIDPRQPTSLPTRLLPICAVPLAQTALTAALTISILYWPLLRVSGPVAFPDVLQYVGAALLLAVDAAAAFRMPFRLSYVFFTLAFNLSWLVFAWVRYAVVRNWPYPGLDFRHVGFARTVLFHFAVVLGSGLVGIVVLATNRLNRLPRVSNCIRKRVAGEVSFERCFVDADVAAEQGMGHVVFSDELGSAWALSSPLPVYEPAQ